MQNIWFQKLHIDYILFYLNNHTGRTKVDIISILNQNDFDFMIEHFQKMSESSEVPYCYYFPTRGVQLDEVRVQMIKHSDRWYTLELNLGAYCLSKMEQSEFDELLRDLSMLQTREINSKVYLP